MRRNRKADFGEQFIGLHIGCQHINEKVSRFDDALAARALQHEFSIQCQRCRRPIGGRIGMHEAAAHRAAIAHLLIADLRAAFGQQGAMLFDFIGRRNGPVRRHRANANRAAVNLDVAQIGNFADVYDNGNLRQT